MKKQELRYIVKSDDIHKIERIEREIETMGHYLGGGCGCRGYLLPECIKVTVVDEQIQIAFFDAHSSILSEVIGVLKKFGCKEVLE
jgi:hypothetical protein